MHAKQASTCALAFDRQTGSSQTIDFSIVVCLLCYLGFSLKMPDPLLLVVYYIYCEKIDWGEVPCFNHSPSPKQHRLMI